MVGHFQESFEEILIPLCKVVYVNAKPVAFATLTEKQMSNVCKLSSYPRSLLCSAYRSLILIITIATSLAPPLRTQHFIVQRARHS